MTSETKQLSLQQSQGSKSLGLGGILKLRGLTIKSKIQIMLFLTSLASVMVVGFVSWRNTQISLKEGIEQHLISIRENKANQVEQFFHTLYTQIRFLSQEGKVLEAMVEFNKGFRKLDRSFISPEWDRALENYYIDDIFPRIATIRPEEDLRYGSYRSTGQAARYLQYYYLAVNPNPIEEKDKLLDAGDDSEYTQAHAEFQKFFRELLQETGFEDLMLVNHRTGNIVYSVTKRIDYGTNVFQGPHAQSGLGEVVRAINNNPQPDMVQIADYRFYRPNYDAPNAFLATPIYSGPNMIGIMVVQLSANYISQVISDNNNWEEAGFDETGEAYLVGSDLRMRSLSRFWVDDPKAYKSAVSNQGTSADTLDLIEKLDTTVSLQKIESNVIRSALGGNKGTRVTTDYRGKPVFTAYSALDLPELNWAIEVNIETSEAFQPLFKLQRDLWITAAVFLMITALMAGFASEIFVKPLQRLIERAGKIATGDLETESELDELELASKDEFGELTQIFHQIVEGFRQTSQTLDQKSQENEILLTNLVPKAIAERIKQGESLIADQLSQVTILYAHLSGIVELNKLRSPEEMTKRLTQLVDALDQMADRYGMEKQQTVDTDYMVVCGLTQPRLDHTKQTFDFALKMLEILEELEGTQESKLSLKIGIHSGSVTAGVVGNQYFGYDLWGEDVYLATRLYTQAKSNQVVVTQAIYERLSEVYPFVKNSAMTIDEIGVVETWTVLSATTVESQQIDLIQSSFAQVLPMVEQFRTFFYQRLFELRPRLKLLFQDNLEARQHQFLERLSQAIQSLREPERLIPMAQDLGRRYAQDGIEFDDYRAIEEALLWSLEKVLGDRFTRSVRNAWEEIYAIISRIMEKTSLEGKEERQILEVEEVRESEEEEVEEENL